MIDDQDQTLSMLQLKTFGTADLRDIPHYIINSAENTIKQCCAPPPRCIMLQAEDPRFFEKLEQVLIAASITYEINDESESD